MDSLVVQRIIQALELVYAPDTPVDERKAAEGVCQQLKDDAQAPAYGIYLATRSSGFPPMVRHFGLQLIEHAAKHRFSTGKAVGKGKMTTDEFLHLRTQMWELLFASAEEPRDPQYIREKLVALMVMLIIRLWPSAQWADLSAQLMHLYTRSDAHRELALRIWQTLGEELLVYDRDAIATVRKNDLTNGIVGALLPRSAVAVLYPNGYRLTTDSAADEQGGGKRATLILLEPGNEDGWILRWAQHAAELSQAHNGELSDEHESTLTLLIDTIATYLDWMPIKAMVATDLVPRLAALLCVRSDQVRLHSAAALEAISRRIGQMPDERDAVLLQFVELNDGAALSAVAHAYAATLPAQADEHWTDAADALVFARSLAQTCANLASLHWARKKLETNVLARPERFVELLMAMSRDSRHSVSALVLASWTAIVRHSALSRVPQVAAVFSTLTEHTTEAIFQVCRAAQALSAAAGNHDALAGIVDEADAEQFESLAEFRLFLTGEVRSRLLNIVRGMCSIDPAGFVGWIMPSLVPVFAPQNAGNQSVIEAAFMIVDAVLTTLDDAEQCALSEGDEQLAAQVRQARAPCYQLGHHVIGFSADDPQMVVRQLQTLPAFAFLLRAAAMDTDEARALLMAILQKCAEFLKHPLDAPNVRELRLVARRSTAALVRLAIAIPDSLMMVYADLSQLVQSRIADPDVTSVVKSHLSEFQLALIAGASCTLAERKQLAQPVVQPIIDALHELMPALQTPTEFIALLGLPALDQAYAQGSVSADTQEALQTARTRRGRLWQVLSTLYVCLNRTLGDRGSTLNLVSLWSDCVNDLVPPILLLIRSLHAMWNPAHYQQLPWQSRQAQSSLFGVLEMSAGERQSIIGAAAEADAAEPTIALSSNGTADVQQQLAAESRAIQHSLSVLRESAYKCLGRLSAVPDMFNTAKVPDLADNFAGCLFADAELMAARHWRFLLTDIAIPVLQNIGNWPGMDASTQLEQCRETIASFASTWLGPLFTFCTNKLDAEWHELMARGMALASNEEIAAVAASGSSQQQQHSITTANGDGSEPSVTDEMVHERVVRDWTRAWSRLVVDLLASVARWFPEAAQIENELSSASRVTASATSTSSTGPKQANAALGAFILNSASAFAGTLTTALTVIRYRDSVSVQRVLLQLAELAPSLVLVSLMPMYSPPTPAHASICNAYTSRIQGSLTSAAADACSSVFTWLATDLTSALVSVLRDAFLIGQQDAVLSLLADMLFFSSSIASDRVPQHWSFRNSSGDIDQRVASSTADDGSKIVPVGDPGHVFRLAVLRTMMPDLQATNVAHDEVDQTVAQLIATSAKRRRALLKVTLQPLLAVEKSQLFSEAKDQPKRSAADAVLTRNAPAS
ncbi:karyopherin, partial [Coemansia sp. RSA 2618]